MSTPNRFHPGLTVVTEEARAALNEAGVSVLDLLLRHLAGDWGDVTPLLTSCNEAAILAHSPIMSRYQLAAGTSLWLVTNAGRTQTTVHLFEGQQQPHIIP